MIIMVFMEVVSRNDLLVYSPNGIPWKYDINKLFKTFYHSSVLECHIQPKHCFVYIYIHLIIFIYPSSFELMSEYYIRSIFSQIWTMLPSPFKLYCTDDSRANYTLHGKYGGYNSCMHVRFNLNICNKIYIQIKYCTLVNKS